MYLVTNFDEKNEIHRFKNGFNEYDQKLFELNQSHQNLKDHFLYAKSKLED